MTEKDGVALGHDDRGRRLEGPGWTVRGYTPFDQPRSVETPDGTTRFGYYPSGERASREGPEPEEGSTQTLYAGLQRVHSARGISQYVPGPAGPVLEARVSEEGRSLRYLHTGRQGTLDETTDTAGGSLTSPLYDPFGQTIDDSGEPITAPLPLGYTGHEHDASRLVYTGARMYEPSSGSFLTPDPFVPDATSSQGFNPYAYVLNNPVQYTDPTGMAPCDASYEGCYSTSSGGGLLGDAEGWRDFFKAVGRGLKKGFGWLKPNKHQRRRPRVVDVQGARSAQSTPQPSINHGVGGGRSPADLLEGTVLEGAPGVGTPMPKGPGLFIDQAVLDQFVADNGGRSLIGEMARTFHALNIVLSVEQVDSGVIVRGADYGRLPRGGTSAEQRLAREARNNMLDVLGASSEGTRIEIGPEDYQGDPKLRNGLFVHESRLGGTGGTLFASDNLDRGRLVRSGSRVVPNETFSPGMMLGHEFQHVAGEGESGAIDRMNAIRSILGMPRRQGYGPTFVSNPRDPTWYLWQR